MTPNDDEHMQPLLGRQVVLDTAGPILFLGTLRAIRPEGFLLFDADLHDRDEGHATKELYLCEARAHGIRVNRKNLFVFRHVVISVSALDDVVLD